MSDASSGSIHAAAPAPFFSVVVPVRDGARTLPDCLAALRRSSFDDWELWVVDDGSADASPAIAADAGAAVLATGGGRGPGAARNLAARRARGEYLFFLDADCELHAGTLAAAHARLLSSPGIEALFGSYDDAPAAPGFVSQYKNLLHHFVHQQGREAAATFWAGCGAVRRVTFLAAGGFDEVRWPRPAIEDIELGYRLRDRGARILLAREVQVKHLKRWTFAALLRSDLCDRALPWARLLLERRSLRFDRGEIQVPIAGDLGLLKASPGSPPSTLDPLPVRWNRRVPTRRCGGEGDAPSPSLRGRFVPHLADLNVDLNGRACAAIAAAGAAAACLAPVVPLGAGWLWAAAAAAAVALLALNRRLYVFFLRRRGALFALGAISMHWLYHLYCAAAAAVAAAGHLGRRLGARATRAEIA
jgi:hypothetical protein